MRIIERYPFSEKAGEIVSPAGLIEVRPYQVIMWVSLSPKSRLRAPGTSRPSVPRRPYNLHQKRTSAADDCRAGLYDAANPERLILPTWPCHESTDLS